MQLELQDKEYGNRRFLLVEIKTINGFNVTFKNSSGTAVSKTFDFIAKGF